MFSRREPSLLEIAVNRALRDLGNYQIGSDEYEKAVDSIVKLHKMKVEEKPSSVSKDTLILAGTNLLGIFMVIKHEGVNVITSKAMNLLLKPR